MKKLFLIWLLSIFCLNLLGCKSKNNEIDTQNDTDIIVDEETGQIEEVVDIRNNEKFLSIYPDLEGFDWSIILWDTLQTNYIESDNSVYFDPYRWIALKLWAEFDGWLIREVDTDEWWTPHSEIIFLIKWDENEENRTGINGFREIFTITAISKGNLENFGVDIDSFDGEIIWENNQYYFTENKSDLFDNNYSDLVIFDIQ